MSGDAIDQKRLDRFLVFRVMGPMTPAAQKFFTVKEGRQVLRSDVSMAEDEFQREMELFRNDTKYMGTWAVLLATLLTLIASVLLAAFVSWQTAVVALFFGIFVSAKILAAAERRNAALWKDVERQILRGDQATG